jgi:hypothetical protein
MIPLYRKGLGDCASRTVLRPFGLSRQEASHRFAPLPHIASASADLRALYGYEPAPIRPKGWHWHAVADLAFETGSAPSTVADMRKRCARAAVDTYTGYKGGDYTYDERTPLWRAQYGCCGPAIMAATQIDGALILVTKDEEE